MATRLAVELNAVLDFLQALGYNTSQLSIPDMIELKNSLFKGIEDSGYKEQLMKPNADKIIDKI
jgi:hypothetical protein